jgi:hypothetical protein
MRRQDKNETFAGLDIVENAIPPELTTTQLSINPNIVFGLVLEPFHQLIHKVLVVT